MKIKHLVATATAALLFATQADAASVPYFASPFDVGNALGYLNAWVQGSLNTSVTPGSMAPYAMGRNFLDNGAMQINQRALTATCATTSGVVETSYSPDRWACDVNMASGAGQLAVVTSTPSPVPGFTNSATLVRNSGSPGLGQPQCALQEVPTVRATQMAGQQVILSAYMQGLAGLVADNGGTANMYLITGTGSQQGLGSLRSGVGMTTTVKASSVTVTGSGGTAGLMTNATSVVAGQPVWLTGTTAPGGFTFGTTYYVATYGLNSGTAFYLSSTYANSQINAYSAVVAATSAGSAVTINVPYITPVWTGVAVYGPNNSGAGQTSAAQGFGQATSNPFTLSATTWGRFNTGPIQVPSNVTEAAVAVCFWPNATTNGGSTDGIAFSGVQLEIAGPNQTTPSPYEFKSQSLEYIEALRYMQYWPEGAAKVASPFIGTYATTTTCELQWNLPIPMDIAPLVTFTGTALSASTFLMQSQTNGGIALASTYLVQSTNDTNTTTSVNLTGTTAAVTAAGQACRLIGNNGGAIINVGADF